MYGSGVSLGHLYCFQMSGPSTVRGGVTGREEGQWGADDVN